MNIKRKKVNNNDKHAKLYVFAFLFALPVAFAFCFKTLFWLLVSMAGVPDSILAMGLMIGVPHLSEVTAQRLHPCFAS